MLLTHHDYMRQEGCGCGSNKAAFDYVPDTIYGLSIKDACCPHDFRYGLGGNEEDKQIADLEFLQNMLMLINEYKKWYYPHFLARRRAMSYYDAVVRFGHSSFNWGGGLTNAVLKLYL